MKSLINLTITFVVFAGFLFGSPAEAQMVDSYYTYSDTYPYQNTFASQPIYTVEYVNSLLQIIAQLRSQQQSLYTYPAYQPQSVYSPYTFVDTTYTGSTTSHSSSSDDEPDVDTDAARDIEDDSAELRGDVDMNDFRNGVVFFVYGQDEDKIEDVEKDYDEYDDVNDDEEDDDFEVVRVDSDLDGDDSYREEVTGLESDEEYFFVLCVEYDDEDDDETLECGDVEDFETDN